MKNIKKILLLLICCFVNINFCYAAASVSFNYNDPGENSDSDEDVGEKEPIEYSLKFEDDDKYTCYFKYNIATGSSLTIHGYNQNNDPIIDVEVTPKEKIKAGTSIGIGIIETATVGWEVTDYWVTKKGEKLGGVTFRKTNLSTGVESTCISAVDGNPKSETDCLNEGFKKEKATYGNIKYTHWNWYENNGEIPTDEKKNECYEKAKGYVEDVAKSSSPSSSYVVTLNNPNTVDVNAAVFTINPKMSGPFCGGNSCSWQFMYSPEYVCLDKRTAEVRYVNGSSCSTNEFYIKNDNVMNDNVEHFHYFVPLNVVNGEYSLLINPKADATKKSKNWCIQAIRDNLNNYYDFLFTSTGGTYKSVPESQNAAEKAVENGCYVRTEIRIPVSEGLYNVDDNQKIKGYNLYVNNVNEYNPFPNPVTNTDSLWFEWYQNNYSNDRKYNGTGLPNFKNSFDEENISYLLKNVKASDIRNLKSTLGNYLNNTLLPSGASKFINGKINFDKFDNNYYQIGCGPLNASKLPDGTANPLHQEGCK